MGLPSYGSSPAAVWRVKASTPLIADRRLDERGPFRSSVGHKAGQAVVVRSSRESWNSTGTGTSLRCISGVVLASPRASRSAFFRHPSATEQHRFWFDLLVRLLASGHMRVVYSPRFSPTDRRVVRRSRTEASKTDSVPYGPAHLSPGH